MIKIISGGAYYDVTDTMIDNVKKALAKNKKIYLIIPDQFSFEYDKRLYKELGAYLFNMIEVLSFKKIAKRILQEHCGKELNFSGEYVDEYTKQLFLFKVLKDMKTNESSKFYQKQLEKADFANTVLGVVDDFLQNSVSVDNLEKAIEKVDGSLKDKLYDLKEIYFGYQKIMEEKGFKDAVSDVVIARKLIEEKDFFANCEVFIDEFYSFSSDELAMIEIIAKQSENLYVALKIGNGENAKSVISPFVNIKNTENALVEIARKNNLKIDFIISQKEEDSSPALKNLSENVFLPKKYTIKTDGDIKVVSATDVYKEIEFVALNIRKMIDENNYKFCDFAVIATDLNVYKTAIYTLFEKYEIPYFIDKKQSVVQKSLVVYILSVLDCVLTTQYKTENILKWAKSPFCEISQESIYTIENYCFKWNVDGKMWTKPFTATNEKNENLDEINAIRCEIIAPFEIFKAKIKGENCGEACVAFNELLKELKVENLVENIAKESLLSNETHILEAVRDFKQIFDIYNKIISSIYNTACEEKITLKEFYSLFKMLFTNSEVSLPPQMLDTVMVADTNRSRLSNVKVAFIVGANEGVFPNLVKESGIFSEYEKNALDKVGINIAKSALWRISEERLVAYNALTCADEKLFISYPICDIKGEAKRPSFLVKQIVSAIEKENVIEEKNVIISEYCVNLECVYSKYLENITKNTTEIATLKKILENDSFYLQKLEFIKNSEKEKTHTLLKNESKKVFNPNNFYLSPTKIETYYNCAFEFFCKYGLKIKPAIKVDVNPLNKGNIIHFCLENIISCVDKSGKKVYNSNFPKLSENELKDLVNEKVDFFVNEKMGGTFAKNARFYFFIEKYKQLIFEIVKNIREEFFYSKFSPCDFEFDLVKNGQNTLSITAPNGIVIQLTGRIDRVDVCENDGKKYLRIVDYKSGNKQLDFEDIYNGLNLQMVLYLFALTKGNSIYNDSSPAGVLYFPAQFPDSVIDRDNFSDEKKLALEIYNKKLTSFRMSGLIVGEENLSFMEANKKGKFIKNKRDLSNVITEKAFARLSNFVVGKVVDLTQKIFGGYINSVPSLKNDVFHCENCDYWSACGNYKNERNHIIRKVDADILLNKINEEGGENDAELD